MQVGGNNFYSIKIDFQLDSALNQFFISQTNVQIICFCLLVFCVISLPILEQFGNIQTNSYAEKNFKTQGLVQKLNPLNREGVYQVTPNVTRGLGFFRFIRRSTPNQLPFSTNHRTFIPRIHLQGKYIVNYIYTICKTFAKNYKQQKI